MSCLNKVLFFFFLFLHRGPGEPLRAEFVRCCSAEAPRPLQAIGNLSFFPSAHKLPSNDWGETVIYSCEHRK